MSTPGELLRAGGWRLGHHGGDPQQPYWEHHEEWPDHTSDNDLVALDLGRILDALRGCREKGASDGG